MGRIQWVHKAGYLGKAFILAFVRDRFTLANTLRLSPKPPTRTGRFRLVLLTSLLGELETLEVKDLAE